MIRINSTMKQKEIQDMFDGKEYGGVTFHFKNKQGMGLMFDADGADGKSADDLKGIVKKQIKSDPMLSCLMITIDVV